MKTIFYAFILLFLSFKASSQVIINEYSCSNMTGVTDAYGNREDWVELYNMGAAPVDLTGYYLSDKSTNLQKMDDSQWINCSKRI